MLDCAEHFNVTGLPACTGFEDGCVINVKNDCVSVSEDTEKQIENQLQSLHGHVYFFFSVKSTIIGEVVLFVHEMQLVHQYEDIK